MKLLGSIVLAIVATTGFATTESTDSGEKIYRGFGRWATATETGKYQILIHKRHNNDGSKTVFVTIDKGTERHHHSMTAVPAEGPFFDILDAGGQSIGRGYCWELDAKKLCHMDVQPTPGVQVEKTVHMTLDEVESIGSMTDADGNVTTWIDRSERIFP